MSILVSLAPKFIRENEYINLVYGFAKGFFKQNILDKFLYVYTWANYLVGKHPLITGLSMYNFVLFSSWIMMCFFEGTVNPDICSFLSFAWFHFCTATTIGYGDITPISDFGRHLVTPYVFFFGSASIITIAGGIVSFVATVIKLSVQGKLMTLKKNHLVIISPHKLRGEKLRTLYLNSECDKHNAIICSEEPIDGKSKNVEYKKFENNFDYISKNTNLKASNCIVLDLQDDNKTILLLNRIKRMEIQTRVVVALQDMKFEEEVEVVSRDYECVLAATLAPIIRAALVPGNSIYNKDIMNPGGGANAYSLTFKEKGSLVTTFNFSTFIREEHTAILVYLRRDGIQINIPPNDKILKDGDIIGYHAAHKISDKEIDYKNIPKY